MEMQWDGNVDTTESGMRDKGFDGNETWWKLIDGMGYDSNVMWWKFECIGKGCDGKGKWWNWM